MSGKFWFVVAGVLVVIGGILALNMFVFSGMSPRGYVAKEFTRTSGNGDDVTYTSSQSPSRVADMIADEWRPVTQYVDDSGIYLRYSDDAIIITPRRPGSLIRVMDDDRAYRTYYYFLGGSWGWSSPHGESFRGRGPGSGK